MVSLDSLSLFYHLFLLIITPGKFSRHLPVSLQTWWVWDFAGWPTMMCPCVGLCWALLISLFFASSAQLVLLPLLGWFVRLEVSGRTVAVFQGAVSKICLKQHTAFWCSSHLAFSSGILLVWVVQPYYSSDMATDWKSKMEIKFFYSFEFCLIQ